MQFAEPDRVIPAAQPKNIDRPRVKGALPPAREYEGRAGLISQPGRERPPDPNGSESAVTTPAE